MFVSEQILLSTPLSWSICVCKSVFLEEYQGSKSLKLKTKLRMFFKLKIKQFENIEAQ